MRFERITACAMGLAAMAIAWIASSVALAVAAPERTRRLPADGTRRSVDVSALGRSVRFEILVVAGCRYRLDVVGETLARPVLSIARSGEEPLARVVGADDRVASHVWNAIRDEFLDVVVTGFSAHAGRATIAFTTLGPGDRPTRAHRRVLVPDDPPARVGDLLLGEANSWDLAVEPGVSYQITPTEGTAGRVHLVLRGENDVVLADSEVGALASRPHPPLRFVAPDPLPAAPADRADAPLRLDVRGSFDGGGSYGLSMRRLAEGETVDPPTPVAPESDASAVLEAGASPVVRARAGDLVLVHVPAANDNPYFAQIRRGERWVAAEGLGREQRARTHYGAGMTWFQPYRTGTFRFVGARGPAPSADVQLLDRASLGGAPIHLGTGLDPEVRARLDRGWRLVALGACMPGWDYLFVLRGAPTSGIAMRVLGPDGQRVAERPASGGTTFSPGLGPTLRFRASRPGIYRLEARDSSGRVVSALLRQAEDAR